MNLFYSCYSVVDSDLCFCEFSPTFPLWVLLCFQINGHKMVEVIDGIRGLGNRLLFCLTTSRSFLFYFSVWFHCIFQCLWVKGGLAIVVRWIMVDDASLWCTHTCLWSIESYNWKSHTGCDGGVDCWGSVSRHGVVSAVSLLVNFMLYFHFFFLLWVFLIFLYFSVFLPVPQNIIFLDLLQRVFQCPPLRLLIALTLN